MNTNDLYLTLLDLSGVKITEVILSQDKIDIHCETETQSWKCPICKKETSRIHQSTCET